MSLFSDMDQEGFCLYIFVLNGLVKELKWKSLISSTSFAGQGSISGCMVVLYKWDPSEYTRHLECPITVFFYVDDIFMVNHPLERTAAKYMGSGLRGHNIKVYKRIVLQSQGQLAESAKG